MIEAESFTQTKYDNAISEIRRIIEQIRDARGASDDTEKAISSLALACETAQTGIDQFTEQQQQIQSSLTSAKDHALVSLGTPDEETTKETVQKLESELLECQKSLETTTKTLNAAQKRQSKETPGLKAILAQTREEIDQLDEQAERMQTLRQELHYQLGIERAAVHSAEFTEDQKLLDEAQEEVNRLTKRMNKRKEEISKDLREWPDLEKHLVGASPLKKVSSAAGRVLTAHLNFMETLTKEGGQAEDTIKQLDTHGIYHLRDEGLSIYEFLYLSRDELQALKNWGYTLSSIRGSWEYDTAASLREGLKRRIARTREYIDRESKSVISW